MPAKSWLILLFWLQNTFAQSSFLGAGTDNLPFFSNFKSSGFPNSPLVHFSQHFGKQQGERKYQTIDIVSCFLIIQKIISIRDLQQHYFKPILGWQSCNIRTPHLTHIVQTTQIIIMIMIKDWVSLFADYITPNGTNVTDACLLAGQRYINQLNQVGFLQSKVLLYQKEILCPKLALFCVNLKLWPIFLFSGKWSST